MIAGNKVLVKELKLNDHKAFEQLYCLYSPKIFGFSRKFFPAKEDAEEIVQIVFSTVWENRSQIDEEKSFLSYIYAIARNHILNIIKRNMYRQAFVNFALNSETDNDFITENEVIFSELQNNLDKCIDELPPKRREVFVLSRKEGLSYREIAKKLTVTESTVNTQITKSIEFIRNRLKELY